MTSADTSVQGIRVRQSFEGDGKPKGYKKSVRFLDESTDQPIYTSDIVGHFARSRITFLDEDGRSVPRA